jgi:ubiquinone biosynthesis monooxygenase Coq7
VPASARATPGANLDDAVLTTAQRRHAAGLMRVNHTGEVCAQALYAAQAVLAVDPRVRREFAVAAREEEDHLAWTQQRLAELDDRPSRLNPVWYAGSFAIAIAAGIAGDRVNLGFVVETERQVEEHLTTHMERLPEADAKSRAIVEKMRDDEARHGAAARAAGAAELPFAGKSLMRVAADVDAIRALPRLRLLRRSPARAVGDAVQRRRLASTRAVPQAVRRRTAKCKMASECGFAGHGEFLGTARAIAPASTRLHDVQCGARFCAAVNSLAGDAAIASHSTSAAASRDVPVDAGRQRR